MPNDAPDWTGLHLVQLLSRSGALLGDPGTLTLPADSAVAQLNSSAGLNDGQSGVLASLKPAVGQTVARVGALGPLAFTAGLNVSPTFGQATTAGNLLVCWLASQGPTLSTVAAGWVKVLDFKGGARSWAGLWIRPNCGAAEAPPVFTGGILGVARMAQLAEFSGAALVAPVDQTGLAASFVETLAVAATTLDGTAADLVVMATGWALDSFQTATFSESYGNNAAAVHAGDTGSASSLTHASFSYGIIPPLLPSLPLTVDVNDRAGRLLGVVTAGGAATWQAPNKVALSVNANLAAGGNAVVIAAVGGQTVTLFDFYYMLDAASAVPAGGLALQDTTPATFGFMSVGVVNPPPWHGSGVQLGLGLGFRVLNNSGAAIVLRGGVTYSQG